MCLGSSFNTYRMKHVLQGSSFWSVKLEKDLSSFTKDKLVFRIELGERVETENSLLVALNKTF